MTLVAPLRRAEILPVMPDLAFLYIGRRRCARRGAGESGADDGSTARLAKRIGLAAGEVVEEALFVCRRWWNKVCLFIAGIKNPSNRSPAFRVITLEELIYSLRLEGGNDFSFSGFCVFPAFNFTHLPFSRSL